MVYRRLQNTALAVTVVFPALATVLVAIRVYSRIVWSHFGWGKLAEIREVEVNSKDECTQMMGLLSLRRLGPQDLPSNCQLILTMLSDSRGRTCLPMVDVYANILSALKVKL